MNTILVIDDNEIYRAGLLEILEFENYITLEAENGQVGWQMIQEHSPSLIICDIDMPVMMGFEVLKKVKSHARFASIPFVMMSGRNDARTMRAAHVLGARQYLTKPIKITELLETISRNLSQGLKPSTTFLFLP